MNTGNTGFTNAGLVEKEFSSGISNIYALFTNTGTVSVQSGTLSFDGGGTSSAGAFTVAAGATLGFGGGNFTLTGGTYTVTGQTLVSGGMLTLAGGAVTTGEFTQSGGTVAGSSTLTVTGPALFSGSYEVGTGTGKTLLKGATEIDNFGLGLDGGWTLENAGTLTLQSGTIYLGENLLGTTFGGGAIVNDKGASFLIETDGTTVQVDTGNTGFTNAGLVEKEFTSGISNIYALFTNTGTVSLQSGTLSLDGGGTSSGAGFTRGGGRHPRVWRRQLHLDRRHLYRHRADLALGRHADPRRRCGHHRRIHSELWDDRRRQRRDRDRAGGVLRQL